MSPLGAPTFVNYLIHEENIEREIYGLDAQDRVLMTHLREKYMLDEGKVLRSAKRNYGADTNGGFDELDGQGEDDK